LAVADKGRVRAGLSAKIPVFFPSVGMLAGDYRSENALAQFWMVRSGGGVLFGNAGHCCA
jgi:hypothetical protein